jgi:hypothetical protein
VTFYSILIFLHVLGAVGVFAAWGIEAVGLGHLRQAPTAEQARTGMALRAKAVPLGPLAMLTALATGLWMMGLRWGHQPWIAAAMVALVLMVAIGVVLERRAGPRLTAALADGRPQLTSTVTRAGELLMISLRLRITLAVAILALMTVKPGTTGSVSILVAALAIGLALTGFATNSSWPWRRLPSPPRSTHTNEHMLRQGGGASGKWGREIREGRRRGREGGGERVSRILHLPGPQVPKAEATPP